MARVQREVRELICTDSKKYAAVRAMFATRHIKASQQSMVILIGAAIASLINVTAAIIIPWVAAALLLFITLGKNVYCGSVKAPAKKPAKKPRKKKAMAAKEAM
jgi:hypothetical protein